MRLEGSASGYVQIQPAAAAGSWAMTLPSGAGSNGQILTTNGSGVTSWTSASSIETDPVVKAINGIVKSNGTTISAAASGTDYSAGTASLATGILKSTTSTGALSIAAAGDINSTFGSQTANYVYAAPNGSAGTPSFRALADADIPDTITLTDLTQITNRSHSSLTGLTNDDHTIYALLAGRAGGQTLIGGTAADNLLTLQANSATSGNTAANPAIQMKVGDSGGTTALTISNNGNVGIGTTAPLSKLDVNGGLAVGSYAGTSAAPSNGLIVSGNVGIGTTSPGGKLEVLTSAANVYDVYSDSDKIAANTNILVSANQLQLASPLCGDYSLQFGGLTYGTVIGEDGKCWMDRNLGATQVATSPTDSASYGYYYQWGRRGDGHQISGSGKTSATSASDVPGHNLFITTNTSPYDWRIPQSPNKDNLWAGAKTNNVCPSGWHVPTQAEWAAEANHFSPQTSVGAFNSALKLPLAGFRYRASGSLYYRGSSGYYWSSSPPVPMPTVCTSIPGR